MNVHEETIEVMGRVMTIPDIVLLVRGSIEGDYDDCIPAEKMPKVRALLERRRVQWIPSDDPIDGLILSMVIIGIELIDDNPNYEF